ncbi:MAG: hypothetical protein H7Z37_10925 [Pyrinomonadaceae bacterium]|nr:hypothetical protein [Pyrinomonadaceae bacterium]
MAGNTVTYEDVFGVSFGGEVQESHGMTWRGCPAVLALKQLLGAFADVLPPHKLGGMSGYWNEFNRHHAGVSVDIMLNSAVETEAILAENLVLLFMAQSSVMRWRGIVYEHVSMNSSGQPTAELRNVKYEASDHLNHIHIDWHDSGNVVWNEQAKPFPFRAKNGELRQIQPKQGNRIATSITWTGQALTDFRQNAGLQTALNELIENYRQGNLVRVNLEEALGLVSK